MLTTSHHGLYCDSYLTSAKSHKLKSGQNYDASKMISTQLPNKHAILHLK